MPATYEPIATYTVSGGSTAAVSFSSLGTYTDIVIIENYALSTASQSVLTFNSSTSGYSNTNLYGNGTSATSSRFTGLSGIGSTPGIGDTANQQNVLIRNVQNFSNSTTYKTVIQRRNDAAASTWATVGLWQNTAAITSITLTTAGGFYNSGSTFTLYGIKAA